jgi:hypothetical protein
MDSKSKSTASKRSIPHPTSDLENGQGSDFFASMKWHNTEDFA